MSHTHTQFDDCCHPVHVWPTYITFTFIVFEKLIYFLQIKFIVCAAMHHIHYPSNSNYFTQIVSILFQSLNKY